MSVLQQSDTDPIVLEALGMTKQYGGQLALKDVSFRVRSGAVNVLIGENGAGKSTLMRLLAGIEKPTSGRILLDGVPLQFHSPRDAVAAGIAIVHQELAVLGNLNVAENIFAGRELVRAGTLINRAAEEQRSGVALKSIGMPMGPLTMELPTDSLSLGCRQLIELARSLAHKARILILDEPTSALSTKEAEVLFQVIEELKSRGVAIVYISHRLHELMHLGDYFAVLRDGRLVGEGVRGEVDRKWIVERMSGHVADPTARNAQSTTETILQVSGLSTRAPGRPAVKNVSFSVCKGEVVGIYGLLGSGRTELLESLAGLRRPDGGVVTMRGKQMQSRSVADAIRAGITLAPEDRQRDGLVPDLSILENISLAALAGFSRYGLLAHSNEISAVKQVAAQMQISATDLDLPVTSLSGGNQQKVVLARCLMSRPAILLLDEPTRGVDVRAKADIYRALRTLASEGLSILFTSSEIEETRLLADRVLVMARGSIVADRPAGELTDEALFAAASSPLELSA
jgi:erythritol transport system ATP-binding protein